MLLDDNGLGKQRGKVYANAGRAFIHWQTDSDGSLKMLMTCVNNLATQSLLLAYPFTCRYVRPHSQDFAAAAPAPVPVQLGKTEGISSDLDLVCKNILWTLAFGWGKVTLPDKRACV